MVTTAPLRTCGGNERETQIAKTLPLQHQDVRKFTIQSVGLDGKKKLTSLVVRRAPRKATREPVTLPVRLHRLQERC